MKRFLFAIAIMTAFSIPSFAACGGSSPNLTAATWADAVLCASSAINGDTITLASGTSHATSTLTLTNKTVTLIGAGCTLSGGIPDGSDCATKVIDDLSSGPLITWSWSSSGARLSGFQIQGGTRIPSSSQNIIELTGTNSAYMRMDHMFLDNLGGFNVVPNVVVGVWDHNRVMNSNDGFILFYIHDADWGGYQWGDGSWAAATNFGGQQSLYIEDNILGHTAGKWGAITDGYGGTRFVIRFNTITRGQFTVHGTESSSVHRGGRAMEIYRNSIQGRDDACFSAVTDTRSGMARIFDNSMTNFQCSPNLTQSDFRTYFTFSGWPAADGRNRLDVNDAGGPFYTNEVATSGSGLSVTKTGANYTGLEGYSIIKTSACSTSQCSSIITSITNAGQTINYHDTFSGSALAFTTGETYSIYKVTHGLDAPGRALGTVLTETYASSVTRGGAGNLTATLTTTASLDTLGISTGDWVMMRLVDSGSDVYKAVTQVTVTVHTGAGADKFTYALASDPGSDIVANHLAFAEIPSTNDQVTEGNYEWNNVYTDIGGGFIHWSAATPDIRANEHYYTGKDGAQTTASSPFSGATGTGYGTAARKPATCTTGVGYWATDEGSWNVSGSGTQGRFYKCTATDTWTLSYTPYTYPNPLASGSSCTPDHLSFSSQPSSAYVGAALGTVTVSVYDSGNNKCTGSTGAYTITIANKGGTCTGMVLGGTKSGTETAGDFTTTNLTEGAAGACTLSATSSPSLTGADSSAFTISTLPVGGTGGGIGARLRLTIR